MGRPGPVDSTPTVQDRGTHTDTALHEGIIALDDESFMDALRLGHAARNTLLKKMDAASKGAPAASRRQHTRYSYQSPDVRVLITHPGGGNGRFIVCARNLSAGGMAFLHGGFLHTGTEVRLTLRLHTGKDQVVVGEVASCRHISRNLHEVGVRFFEKIDPTAFCGPDAQPVAPATVCTSAGEQELSGQALIIGIEGVDRKLLKHRLSSSGMAVVDIGSIGPALDQLKRLDFHVVFCGVELAETTAAEAIRDVRQAGYTGPIIAFGAKDLEQGANLGANGTLAKQFQAADLVKLVRSLTPQTEIASRAPIYSALADDPDAHDLIINYIEQAHSQAKLLASALATDSLQKVKSLCMNLRASGSGYGFQPVFEAAKNALREIEAEGSLAAAKANIEQLIDVCNRLKPGLPLGQQPGKKPGS